MGPLYFPLHALLLLLRIQGTGEKQEEDEGTEIAEKNRAHCTVFYYLECFSFFSVCCSVRFAASELFLLEATTVAFGTCWAMAEHFPSFRALQSNPMCENVADLTTATGGAASSFLSTY
jgi:hypothetical protein